MGSGVVAQMVEQRTENPCVTGSIPVDATDLKTLNIDDKDVQGLFFNAVVLWKFYLCLIWESSIFKKFFNYTMLISR